ncbi:hypothetical protein I7V34_21185 [Bacillus sp. V3]|nr:hypothetical protein I7V34_21185 [Bacillus sp. V3]
MFSKGFSLQELNIGVDEDYTVRNLIIPCLHDSSLFQFNAINDDDLREKCKPFSLSEEQITRLIALQSSRIMNNDEVWNFLLDLCPEINNLMEIWINSSIKNMTLTSVGIALAHANIRRKINENWDLSIWI